MEDKTKEVKGVVEAISPPRQYEKRFRAGLRIGSAWLNCFGATPEDAMKPIRDVQKKDRLRVTCFERKDGLEIKSFEAWELTEKDIDEVVAAKAGVLDKCVKQALGIAKKHEQEFVAVTGSKLEAEHVKELGVSLAIAVDKALKGE